MTRQEFSTLTKEGIVLLDGATGSNLMLAGMPKGVCTEQWVTEHPDILQDLQREYKKAGSQIIYAPTFSANRISLAAHGLEDQVEGLNRHLVSLTREAVGKDCLVAGDITTTGKTDEGYDLLYSAYAQQISALAEGGADLLVAETMIGLEETMAALDAARAVCDLPMMCSMTIQADGSLFFGGTIFETVCVLEELGADAVGINCSVGPDQLTSIIERLSSLVSIPVIAKPNAGMPVINDKGQAVYDMAPEAFAEHMKALTKAGARIIGGCCGTTPAYIRAMAEFL